jgi:ABC-2 type transport system permease protein
MAEATLPRTPAAAPQPTAGRVRRAAGLAAGQLRYADRGFWRTPAAAFFTLAFPLIWLVLIVLLTGNTVVDPGSGVRVAQFLAPVAVVFAAVMGSYVTLAMTIAQARDQGVLKRLRGTPLPPWAFFAGRVGSAVETVLYGVGLSLAVAVAGYGVRIPGRTLPALLLTLAVGIACFAALGLAVVAVVRSQQLVLSLTLGTVILLGFVSDMFGVGATLPRWLEAVGWFFPLRHFVNAMMEVFDPFTAGAGFAWDHLGVMAAWMLAGVAAALRWFAWEPGGATGGRGAASARAHADVQAPTRGRAGIVSLLWSQLHYAHRTLWRDPSSTFFAVVFPVVLLVAMGSIWSDVEVAGVPLTYTLTVGVAVYGAGVTAFINMPETVGTARDRGVLKRLRGTPLPLWAYVAGRVGSALGVGLLSAALALGAGALLFDVRPDPAGLPAVVVTVLVSTACLASLGLALTALTRDARTATVLGIAVLLILSFVSGVFPVGVEPPAAVERVAAFFPLWHAVQALDGALRAAGAAGFAWGHLAVMAAWGAAGAIVAATRLLREPRAARP